MPHYGERLRGESALREMREADLAEGLRFRDDAFQFDFEENEFVEPDTIVIDYAQPVTIRHYGSNRPHHSGKSRT